MHYWLVATTYLIAGQNAFTTRISLALAMIALVLVLNFFGRRFFGARAGFYSGLVAATGIGFFLFTRIMIPEAIFALELAIGFYLFLLAWTKQIDPRLGYWGCAAMIGLAVLTLGLVGVVFPVRDSLAFLYPHARMESLARAANFLEHPDFSGDCAALAFARRTSLARISLVLYHQRAFQAGARNALSAGLRFRAARDLVARASRLVRALERFSSVHAFRNFRIREPGEKT